MSKNDFHLKIAGPDVSPRSVDVDDLAEVIRSYRGALSSLAGSLSQLQKVEPEEITLGLVGVSGEEPDTDVLTLHGSDQCVVSARVLNTILADSKEQSLPSRTRQFLRRLWKATYNSGWDSCQFIGNGSGIGTATISREKELIPDHTVFRGMTVLYGQCTRVGGVAKRTARIKLVNGDFITVRLRTFSLAKQIGERLYQTIGLKGEATWSHGDNKLIEFMADSLTDFTDRNADNNRRTTMEAFKALAQAAGKRWEGVNPEEFVQEQRRD